MSQECGIELSPLTSSTVLHLAVEKNDPCELRVLLKDDTIKSKFINEKDDLGKTAVFLASEKGHAGCLLLLIENNADLNLRDCSGRTPAYIAAKNKHCSCLKELMAKKADLKISDVYPKNADAAFIKYLHEIIAKGNEDELKLLWNEITDIHKFNESDLMGKTAAHLAVEKNELEILKFLIEIGSDVNKKDILGRTPLWIAAQTNHKKCLKLLVKNNCNVDEKDLLNMTPSHTAAENNSVGCLKVLLEKKVDLTSPNLYGYNTIDLMFTNIYNPEKYILDALNSGIHIKKSKTIKKNFEFDFTILSAGNQAQMEVISKLFAASNKLERTKIFSHPLFEIFFTLKRSKKIYKIMSTVQYVLLIVYWFLLYYYLVDLRNVDLQQKQNLHYLRYFTSFAAVTRFTIGILQFIASPPLWFRKYNTVKNVVTPGLILIIQVLVYIAHTFESITMLQNYIIYLTSITAILICIEIFFSLSKLPIAQNYTEMFFLVSQRVFTFFFVFFWILIGFAICFHILLYYYEEFNDLPRSIFKTIVMMTGEFEYENIFTQRENATTAVIERIASPVPKFIFILFINMIYIVVGNVMIGMAVQDVHTLKNKYYVKKIQQQAEHFQQIEIIFEWLSSFCKIGYVKKLINEFFKQNYVESHCEMNESRIFKISSKVLDSIKNIAKKNKKNKKAQK